MPLLNFLQDTIKHRDNFNHLGKDHEQTEEEIMSVHDSSELCVGVKSTKRVSTCTAVSSVFVTPTHHESKTKKHRKDKSVCPLQHTFGPPNDDQLPTWLLFSPNSSSNLRGKGEGSSKFEGLNSANGEVHGHTVGFS